MNIMNKGTAPFALLVAAIFLAAPFISLMAFGVFSWHIQQPPAWQGGLVLLVLGLCIYIALKFFWGRLRWVAICICLWIYARNQGVDLSIVMVWLYIESIFALGWCLLPLGGCERSHNSSTIITAGM